MTDQQPDETTLTRAWARKTTAPEWVNEWAEKGAKEAQDAAHAPVSEPNVFLVMLGGTVYGVFVSREDAEEFKGRFAESDQPRIYIQMCPLGTGFDPGTWQWSWRPASPRLDEVGTRLHASECGCATPALYCRGCSCWCHIPARRRVR